MRYLIVLALLVLFPVSASAQSKELAEARLVAVHVGMYELSLVKLTDVGDKLADMNYEALSALQLEEFSSRKPPVASADTRDEKKIISNSVVTSNDLSDVWAVLRDAGALTTIAEPSVVTTSGRPATYRATGEAPVVVPDVDGKSVVDYLTFGTEFDCRPVVLKNGRVRVYLQPRNSQITALPRKLVDGGAGPDLYVREVQIDGELGTDETLVSTGLIAKRPVDNGTEVIQLVVTVRVELPDVPEVARRPSVELRSLSSPSLIQQ